MWIKKKTLSLVITYSLAAFLLVSAHCLMNRDGARSFTNYQNSSYAHAFTELSSSISELSNSLNKASYASSPAMISATCTEAYANASAARAALGALPYANMELEHTAAFLSKAGDYAAYLGRSAAAGRSYTDEERDNLVSLAKSASTLSEVFTRLNANIVSGEMSPSQLEFSQDTIAAMEDDIVDTSFAGSFKKMEADFPELPTLIYDGPFSEHIATLSPKLLEGENDISETEAIKAASEFTGLEKSAFSLDHNRESDIPVYVITASTRRGPMTLEITRAGGYVLYYANSRASSDSHISTDDALRIAAEFLAERRIRGMETTYWQIEDNKLVISYAYTAGDVTYYPDLIKVGVALDNGEVVNFESQGYIMSHYERELPAVKVSAEEAEGRISGGLKSLSNRLAVIPTSGKNEVFCHEFKCEDADGRHCLVYVNVETGFEEKILILLEDENGTLTI